MTGSPKLKQSTIVHDIHAMAPVNKVAVWVIGPGEDYKPNKIIQNKDQKNPLPIREIKKSEKLSPSFVDLTGKKFGRFTVIGKSADYKGQWVVRCSCGIYTARHSKAINNPSNTLDRCEECRHLAFLKKEFMWRSTGHDFDVSIF